MPDYQCDFLDGDGEPVRTEVFLALGDPEARREAMKLMARVGRFSGFELWTKGRIVAEYPSVKDGLE
jgi:hypothetical protein